MCHPRVVLMVDIICDVREKYVNKNKYHTMVESSRNKYQRFFFQSLIAIARSR
jgi:hypothetical protein